MAITRKKPWNRVSLPVYSVCSWNQKFNMNICTYASAVSMHPKMMMVALYEGTQTLANVEANGEMILQTLAQHQYTLVGLLGKKSGSMVDKMNSLEKRKLLQDWNKKPVLRESLCCMHLQVTHKSSSGDHVVFICDVKDWINLNDGTPLTTTILNEKGIIRI